MTFSAKKYSIIHTPSFEKELKEIIRYITFNLNEHITSKKFYNNLLTRIYSLQYFPERYSKINHRNKILRKLPIHKYIVIYEVDNHTRASFYSTYFSWKSKLFKSFINIKSILSNNKIPKLFINNRINCNPIKYTCIK